MLIVARGTCVRAITDTRRLLEACRRAPPLRSCGRISSGIIKFRKSALIRAYGVVVVFARATSRGRGLALARGATCRCGSGKHHSKHKPCSGGSSNFEEGKELALVGLRATAAPPPVPCPPFVLPTAH